MKEQVLKTPKNILVIMLRYIGDVLLTTPVLRTLRMQVPGARITVMVNAGTEDVLGGNPNVDHVLVVQRRGLVSQMRFLRQLRASGFDCVIDLTDGDRSALLSRLTGAPIRIGYDQERRWRGLLYTAIVRLPTIRLHRVERNLEAVRAIGLEPKGSALILKPSRKDEEEAADILRRLGLEDAAHPLVMLHPGARYWFKSWPVERFAVLADRLSEELGCAVVVGGSEADRPVAETIQARARSKPVLLAGGTTLPQLAAILKRCRLFVGNDNGPMHMAAALQVPLVALFGPSDPAIWGPRGGAAEVIYRGDACHACVHPTCVRGEESCMHQISVEEVLAASRRLLASPLRQPVSGVTA